MKILLSLLVFISSYSFSQSDILNGKNDKKPCYQKSVDLKKNKYAEWECGKVAGVVDCNEKLEMTETNLVVTTGGKMPYSGVCETCHMNGLLERRVTFVNGRTNGVDTTYYPSGCIMVIRSHVQGVEDGNWTYFKDSTNLPEWEKHYRLGQLDGPQVDYYVRGNKCDTMKYETYTDGVLQGNKITYNYKGQRTKSTNYVDGLLDGPFLVYNKDGQIIEELTYKKGKKNGILKYYYDDGTLLRTENWKEGVPNGEFKTVYFDQSLQTIESYKNGLKEGRFEERFANGKLKRQATYKKDVLIEEHVFNEAGQEIKTFGGKVTSGKEDDAMPTTKKKKEKKKKEKKKEGE